MSNALAVGGDRAIPKTALITGAASGIGRAFAYEFVALLLKRNVYPADIVLVLVDRDGTGLENTRQGLATEYPGLGGIHPIILDLSADDAAARCADFCDSIGITPDVVINNAGIFAFDPLLDMDISRINDMLNLHVRGLTAMSRAFGLRMRRKGYGYIINMSSMSVWMTMPGIGIYNASKSFVRGLSRSLHYELAPFGVSVTSVCPAGVDTPLIPLPDSIRTLARRLGFLMHPRRLARLALRSALNGSIQTIPGALNDLFAFIMSVTPGFAIRAAMRFLPIYRRFLPPTRGLGRGR